MSVGVQTRLSISGSDNLMDVYTKENFNALLYENLILKAKLAEAADKQWEQGTMKSINMESVPQTEEISSLTATEKVSTDADSQAESEVLLQTLRDGMTTVLSLLINELSPKSLSGDSVMIGTVIRLQILTCIII